MNSGNQNSRDTLFEFPCQYPIKVFGPALPEFRKRVLTLIGKHVGSEDQILVRVNHSRKGRYQSLTLTIEARDRAQLDAIYQDLTACELVAMAL